MAVLEAQTTKDLGLSKSEVSQISKLFKGNKNENGMSARSIAETTGIPRRRVMKALEILGLTQFSVGSYV